MKRLVKILLGTVIAVGVLVIVASLWAGQELKNTTPEQAAQALQQSDPPKFNMRGLTPNLRLADAKSKQLVSGCDTQDNMTWCELTDPVIAGRHSLESQVAFENDHFKMIYATFGQGIFSEILEALRSAYGAPCQISTKRLQNAFSAEFDSREVVWCFNGGEMTFIERTTENVRESLLSYAPYEPSEAPKQFTPDEI